ASPSASQALQRPSAQVALRSPRALASLPRPPMSPAATALLALVSLVGLACGPTREPLVPPDEYPPVVAPYDDIVSPPADAQTLAWQSLGGAIAEPVAALNADGRLEVF